jgi:hypothetical protein
MTFAPAKLPLASRPIPEESLSSWLLRVAAANYLTLAELLDGLESRYPGASNSQSLDFNIQPLFLDAISAFCRVPVDKIRALDLSQRLPHLKTVLLLRFPGKFSGCLRAKGQRVAYAFCPRCLADQRVIHVRWEWGFACITRCSTHPTRLQMGCTGCGESDPLLFNPPGCAANFRCRSCDYDLIQVLEPTNLCMDEKIMQAVADVYRLALLGLPPDSSLIGRVTDRAFRTFVDDLLQLLIRYSDPVLTPHKLSREGKTPPPQEALSAVIANLIANAAPSPDARCRSLRHRSSVKLWTTLLTLIPAFAGQSLQEESRFWPMPLQRRFHSALRAQKQKRWPHSPFSGDTSRLRFRCIDTISVLDLSAANPAMNGESSI